MRNAANNPQLKSLLLGLALFASCISYGQVRLTGKAKFGDKPSHGGDRFTDVDWSLSYRFEETDDAIVIAASDPVITVSPQAKFFRGGTKFYTKSELGYASWPDQKLVPFGMIVQVKWSYKGKEGTTSIECFANYTCPKARVAAKHQFKEGYSLSEFRIVEVKSMWFNERADNEILKRATALENNKLNPKAGAATTAAGNKNTANAPNGASASNGSKASAAEADDFWETGTASSSKRAGSTGKQAEGTKSAPAATPKKTNAEILSDYKQQQQKSTDDFFNSQVDMQQKSQVLEANLAQSFYAARAVTESKENLKGLTSLDDNYKSIEELEADFNRKYAAITQEVNNLTTAKNQELQANYETLWSGTSQRDRAVGEAAVALGSMVNSMKADKEKKKAQEALKEEREEQKKRIQELEREREEQKKKLLLNMRQQLLAQFPDGGTPLTAHRVTGDEVYFFSYVLDKNTLNASAPVAYVSNVFPIGRYADGTWPFKNSLVADIKQKTDVNGTLTLMGYYTTRALAQETSEAFIRLAEKCGITIKPVTFKGKGASGSATDFWGTGNAPKSKAAENEGDDFWGIGNSPKPKTPVKTEEEPGATPDDGVADYDSGWEEMDKEAYTTAMAYFKKSAAKGHRGAMHTVGYLYDEGKGVKQDDTEAIKWYRKAIEKGEVKSMNNLAYMYEYGEGVAQDYAEALKWYKKAAEGGVKSAMFNLAQLYVQGSGINQDYTQAMIWFKKAADAGNGNAMYEVGELYFEGNGVAQDYTEAMTWYKKAAARENGLAMNSLGHLYLHGLGVDKNYEEAMKWFKKATDKDIRSAMHNLGYMYQKGLSVEPDYAEAMRWFKQAADKGLAASMRAIALIYEEGLGVPVNKALAAEWRQKAAQAQ